MCVYVCLFVYCLFIGWLNWQESEIFQWHQQGCPADPSMVQYASIISPIYISLNF